jgi:hypothetical protein
MHTLFMSEGAQLDEQERSLVAHEVALTLAQSNISAGLLVEHNLNPQRLARHLISLRPDATKLLSTTQAALYERTLAEAARAITQVADQLSGFDRVRTAAQLESDDRIPAGIAKLLAAPSELDFVGQATYDVCVNLKGTSKDKAMQAYVDLLEKVKSS